MKKKKTDRNNKHFTKLLHEFIKENYETADFEIVFLSPFKIMHSSINHVQNTAL